VLASTRQAEFTSTSSAELEDVYSAEFFAPFFAKIGKTKVTESIIVKTKAIVFFIRTSKI
jgi:hypothetical protein